MPNADPSLPAQTPTAAGEPVARPAAGPVAQPVSDDPSRKLWMDTSAADRELERMHHGTPIQCQFCVGQKFRRSRLRGADIRQLLLMRYPVRCTRCSQRQTVSFTIDGAAYEIDLGPKNARALRVDLEKWTASARKAKRSTAPRARRGSAPKPVSEAAAIRTWAAENGIEVPARGRILSAIAEQYAAAS